MSIIIAFLILGIVIIVHELGHFVAAKLNGIMVEEFSVGMGPRIISTQRGETLYSLRVVPFGGSCMMKGEDEDNVMVTHERELAGCADRVITIMDGKVQSDVVVDEETRRLSRAEMFKDLVDLAPAEPQTTVPAHS